MSAPTRTATARPWAAAGALALASLLAACGSSQADGATTPGSSATSSRLQGSITVFAAASLQETFTQIGAEFEKQHPGTTVTFTFGPSSGLATQITQGAPADVFASASATTMKQVVDAGEAASPTTFATNTMQIAVPPSNPAGITGLADLARPGVKVALCQAQVPCGSVAAKVLANARVGVKPVTLEADVKSTLTKVRLGEVDAGIVYVTDVKAAGAAVKGIEIRDAVNASTAYPIATVKDGANPALAGAFVAAVLSDEGETILAKAGFTAP